MDFGSRTLWLVLAIIELGAGLAGLAYATISTILWLQKGRLAKSGSAREAHPIMATRDVLLAYSPGGMAVLTGVDDLLVVLEAYDSVPHFVHFALQAGSLVCTLLAIWFFVRLFGKRQAPEMCNSEQ